MKILALDVGNTRTKYHLFENDTLKSFGILNNHGQLQEIITAFAPDKIGLSSVNPVIADALVNELPPLYIQSLIRISSSSRLNFQLDYETPQTLGSDRICSMAGAVSITPQAEMLFVIDSGTCITLNLISNGVFSGGFIAPGIDTMLRSMHDYTGSLPLLEKYVPENFEGKNTNDSMMSGVLVFVSGIANFISGITISAKINPVIYITGGNGLYLKNNITLPASYEEHLVALGIKQLVYLNS